jgi:hypothetical protein
MPKDKIETAHDISPSVPSAVRQRREKFLDHIATDGATWISYSKDEAKNSQWWNA